MRTTIELPEELRARLRKVAAERGERGFSAIVQEAVEAYLEREEKKREARQAALDTRGALAGEEGEAFETRVREIREHWK